MKFLIEREVIYLFEFDHTHISILTELCVAFFLSWFEWSSGFYWFGSVWYDLRLSIMNVSNAMNETTGKIIMLNVTQRRNIIITIGYSSEGSKMLHNHRITIIRQNSQFFICRSVSTDRWFFLSLWTSNQTWPTENKQ